jgi:hypothetical protein
MEISTRKIHPCGGKTRGLTVPFLSDPNGPFALGNKVAIGVDGDWLIATSPEHKGELAEVLLELRKRR